VGQAWDKMGQRSLGGVARGPEHCQDL